VVNTVAMYYNLARAGTEPLMYLNCKGFKKQSQPDCRTYTPTGKLNYTNRYDVRSITESLIEQRDFFDPVKIMADFSEMLTSQSSYNSGGSIRAISILTYHNVGLENGKPYSTQVGLFGQEMKYWGDERK
jgi:hypothetical protein